MDFAYDEKTQELRERLLKFMDTDVFPAWLMPRAAPPPFHQQKNTVMRE